MAIANRHVSPFEPSTSPQPQPLSKRDVRRSRIMDKLNGMISTFNSNQHNHYRAQLQGVQVDMNMVLRADPYGPDAPLSENSEDIHNLIAATLNGNEKGEGAIILPNDEAAQRDFYAIAGKRYTEFVREVNDAIEQRDADLTALHNNYHSSLSELDRLYQQRLHQAEEEHKALSATIRQRLVTTLGKKRQQLLRDKEQLDISDSNAMLLHPNHFSIGNNPGSPSHNGTAINKRTRHLRHHRGASPAPGNMELENGKRKRKFGQIDDEQGNESPLPPQLVGGRSPFKNARDQREYAQFDAPAYSMDRLFTEKELALATTTAQQATYKYFHQPQEQGSNSNGTAVPSVDGEVVESAEVVPEEQMLDAPAPANGTNTPPPSEPPAAAPGMERSASHQVLTRGGAKANPLAALSDLANAAAAASSTAPIVRHNPFTPVAPNQHPITRSEKSGAPAPLPVNNLDIENDFQMMEEIISPLAETDDDVNMDPTDIEKARDLRRQLLDQALGVSGVQAPYRLPQLEPGPGAMIDRRGAEREPRTGFAPLLPAVARIESRLHGTTTVPMGSMAAALGGRLGGAPMSRTTSAGGASELGEAPGPARRGGRGKLV